MKLEYAMIILFGIFTIVEGIKYLLEEIRRREYRQIAFGSGMVITGVGFILTVTACISETDKLLGAIMLFVGLVIMIISYYYKS